MRSFLLGASGLLVLVIIAVVGTVSMQPDTYHVERSTPVSAAPADLFPYANDYTKWATWNPFALKDLAMKTESSNPPSGVGAWTTWEGNAAVGAGRMTVTASIPDEKVVHKVEFYEPFADTGTATFTLTPYDDDTVFTWSMDGNLSFGSKLMGLFVSMDDMLGRDFEAGLATLKREAEADAVARRDAERAAGEVFAGLPAEEDAGVGAPR